MECDFLVCLDSFKSICLDRELMGRSASDCSFTSDQQACFCEVNAVISYNLMVKTPTNGLLDCMTLIVIKTSHLYSILPLTSFLPFYLNKINHHSNLDLHSCYILQAIAGSFGSSNLAAQTSCLILNWQYESLALALACRLDQ